MIFDKIDIAVGKKQGNLGVARAVYEYTKMGYTVLAPLSDSDKYDLVVDTGVSLCKVQVKTSRHVPQRGKGYEVSLTTSGGNTKTNTSRGRQENDYDLLFVLTETGECWNIPVDELGKATKAIVVGNTKYNEFKL